MAQLLNTIAGSEGRRLSRHVNEIQCKLLLIRWKSREILTYFIKQLYRFALLAIVEGLTEEDLTFGFWL